jgi:hypothetical protein
MQQYPRDDRGRFMRKEEQGVGKGKKSAEREEPINPEGDVEYPQDWEEGEEEGLDETQRRMHLMEQELWEMKDMMKSLIQSVGRLGNQRVSPQRISPQPTYEHPLQEPPIIDVGNTQLQDERRVSPTTSVASSSVSDASSLKKEVGKAVPTYEGDIYKPQKLFEFIEKLEAYYEITELSDYHQVMYAATKLSSTAHIWWTSQKKKGTSARRWEEMKMALIRRFVPPEHVNLVREKIDKLEQKYSVVAYNEAFNRLITQLPLLPYVEQQYLYLRGLKPRIKELVSVNQYMDLEDLQMAAIRHDSPTSHKALKNLEVEANASDHGTRGKGNARGRDRGRGRFNKGRGGRFDKFQRRKGCYLCDEEDHYARECPTFKEAKKIREQRRKAKEKSEDVSDDGKEANFTHVEANLSLATHKRSPYSILVDSGATAHIIKDKFLIENYRQLSKPIPVSGGKVGSEPAMALGRGVLTVSNPRTDSKVTFEDVLYVPDYPRNLVTTQRLPKGVGACLEGNESPNTGLYVKGSKKRLLDIRVDGHLPLLVGTTTMDAEGYVTMVTNEDMMARDAGGVTKEVQSGKDSTATSKN